MAKSVINKIFKPYLTYLGHFLDAYTYQNLAVSWAYFPSPINGGAAISNDMTNNIQINHDDQKDLVVGVCQCRWSRTTERYLTSAIPIMVYREFIP